MDAHPLPLVKDMQCHSEQSEESSLYCFCVTSVSNYIISICPEKNGFAETSIYKTIASQTWNRLEKKGDVFLPDTASYIQKQFFQEYNRITCCAGEMILENLVDFKRRILLSELPEKEQEIFLIAVSVGLASYKYWTYQIENFEKSIWKKFITIEELLKRKNNVEWKDRLGASIGFLIGGAFGNPVLGAVIGGVAASVGALVNESLEQQIS
ncbi:MAG: hypothetical protein ABIJ97_10735 [Bacteroidota bacterium]